MVSGLSSKREEALTLLQKLSLKQKIRILSGRGVWTLKEIPFLNVPSVWLCDGPHGLRKQENEYVTDLLMGRVQATCFPTASCLACSWDPQLLRRVGTALGVESRAHKVTVLLGPGINLIRDPRGGRSFEYFSEDPFLTGLLASAWVDGVQSQGVGVSLKHFFANNQENYRFVVDVIVDERTQRELYERAFEYVIRKCQPWTIMCAYNQVNGVYCSELKQHYSCVREEWGFDGLVMTDWGATNNRPAAIAAGCDLEMPGSYGACDGLVEKAIQKGALTEEEIDDCATRVLSLMLLGKDIMSEPPSTIDYLDEHHDLAREAAMKSIVLLKNENSLLPLAPHTSVSVFGEFATNPRYQGMGSSEVHAYKIDNPLEWIKTYSPNARYAIGNDLDEARLFASETEVALVFCGLSEADESEAFDRPHIDIPEEHETLIDIVSKANAKTVVILSNGAPVHMPWTSHVPAILESFLSGQGGGSAVVDLIYGKASPCGKLTQTIPMHIKDVSTYKWFPGTHRQAQYREGLNVGYRYYDSAGIDVQFPFGHGLTYSTMEMRNLRVGVGSDAGKEILVKLSLDVENTGSVKAAEVVQCYVHDCKSTVYRPEHELNAFEKVSLEPSESKTVTLHLGRRAFVFWDVGVKEWISEPGDFEIRLGYSSRDIRLRRVVSLQSGVVASVEAQTSYPQQKMPLRFLPDLNEDFEAMLGRPIPTPMNAVTIVNYNTLVGDIQDSMLGRILKRQILAAMAKNIDNDKKEAQRKFAEELAHSTPLRSLVLWSNGILTFSLLDLLIDYFNGNYFSLLVKFPWALTSYAWRICCGSGNRL